ncbi:hypothetical protein [Nocardioides sp.]|uniref:hypothetical protein n=1 Tax=Nocardioides sp. TaxID=35761 RepID=UPI00238F79D4|nr:hypothetical protein [Nocardioides sp.]MDE0776138.1 hypothetical protein [Nocardioides sp.]
MRKRVTIQGGILAEIGEDPQHRPMVGLGEHRHRAVVVEGRSPVAAQLSGACLFHRNLVVEGHLAGDGTEGMGWVRMR